MKNLLPAIVLISSMLLGSCTQEYICQCSIKYTGNPPGLPDSSIVEFKIRNTKKEASTQCKANSTTVTKDGITLIETCQLY